MIYQYGSGTQTATVGTEHTLQSVPDQRGDFQLIVDLSNMASGDVMELRAYQKTLAGGTSRVVALYTFYGAQPANALIFNSDFFLNDLTTEEGVKFTLKQTFGTGRNFAWKVLYEETDEYTLWDAALASHVAANTFGKLLNDNINATISSRLAAASYTAPDNTTISTINNKLGAFTGSGLNTVLGFFRALARKDAPLTPSDMGGTYDNTTDSHEAVKDNQLDAAISSRLAGASYAAPDNAGIAAIKAKTDQLVFTIANKVDASIQAAGDFAQAAADKVWATAARTLTAFGFNVTVGSNLDKAGYSLASGQILVKRGLALNNFEFLMKSSGDHVTPATGLSVTAQRSIDGGAFSACTNAVTEVGNGVYKINLSSADLNGTVVTLLFTASGADQRTITIVTQA